MVKNPNNYDILTRPVCAFITFESDDGYNEALRYSQKISWLGTGYRQPDYDGFEIEYLMGADIEFTAAPEPTNIIWENRHIKGIKFYSRATSAGLITTFMLILSFAAIYYFKKISIDASNEFPEVNCPAI